MPIPTTFSDEKPSNSDTMPSPQAPADAKTDANTHPTTQTKTEAEEEADRLYEERIEEEYAKREGGA